MYVCQDIVIPGSVPPLSQACLAAIQNVIKCLPLATETSVIDKFSHCLKLTFVERVSIEELVRVVACAVTETKCPLLMALFSLSLYLTFLPVGVIVGFRNFAWGFNSQKK